ncbi:MAG: hypothetical protein ABSG57_03035 [Candidatus Bathyarchaeia archaeon]
MSKPNRSDRKAEVGGISSSNSIKRYSALLENKLGAFDVKDNGEYVLLHKRIRLPAKKFIDAIVYSTDRIYISGSAYIDSDEFGQNATRIVELAQQAISPVENVRPISIQSAKDILDFAKHLNLDKDYERMIAIILSDTSNEIVLREKMKAFQIAGVALDDSIPEKIRRLREKGCQFVEEVGIKNLREIRNKIVHYGEIPHKGQAEECLKLADRVLRSV